MNLSDHQKNRIVTAIAKAARKVMSRELGREVPFSFAIEWPAGDGASVGGNLMREDMIKMLRAVIKSYEIIVNEERETRQ